MRLGDSKFTVAHCATGMRVPIFQAAELNLKNQIQKVEKQWRCGVFGANFSYF